MAWAVGTGRIDGVAWAVGTGRIDGVAWAVGTGRIDGTYGRNKRIEMEIKYGKTNEL